MVLADAASKVWLRESGREREIEREQELDFVRQSESAVSAEAQLPSAAHLWAWRWRGLHHYSSLSQACKFLPWNKPQTCKHAVCMNAQTYSQM